MEVLVPSVNVLENNKLDKTRVYEDQHCLISSIDFTLEKKFGVIGGKRELMR